MNGPAAAALNVRITLCSGWHRLQEQGTVMTYCEKVNYLLDVGEQRHYHRD